MKATGIIRHIDELGRIVIPKEIRKNFRIIDGENIEIFLNDDSIVLKKFSSLNTLNELANAITKSINQITNKIVLITDTNNVVSISGKSEWKNKKLSDNILNIIKLRKKVLKKDNMFDNDEYNYLLEPININGDLIGSLIIASKEEIKEIDKYIAILGVKIINNYIE